MIRYLASLAAVLAGAIGLVLAFWWIILAFLVAGGY